MRIAKIILISLAGITGIIGLYSLAHIIGYYDHSILRVFVSAIGFCFLGLLTVSLIVYLIIRGKLDFLIKK
jgi:hypothetical protein